MYKKMTLFTQKTSEYYLISICTVIIISSFLPWAKIMIVDFSGLEFGLGAFNQGKIDLFQIQMLLVPLLPLMLIFFVMLEKVRKKKVTWIIYFISGGIVLYITVFNGIDWDRCSY